MIKQKPKWKVYWFSKNSLSKRNLKKPLNELHWMECNSLYTMQYIPSYNELLNSVNRKQNAYRLPLHIYMYIIWKIKFPFAIFTLKFITKCKVFSVQKGISCNWLPVQHSFFFFHSFMINDHLYSNINKNSFKSRMKTRINANISFELAFVNRCW